MRIGEINSMEESEEEVQESGVYRKVEDKSCECRLEISNDKSLSVFFFFHFLTLTAKTFGTTFLKLEGY